MAKQPDLPAAPQRSTIDAASRRIMQDKHERDEFLGDPAAYLKRAGVPVGGVIKLSNRDKEIIKMVADPEVAAIYKAGDIAKLSQYLRDTYQGLVNDPGRRAWAVADFEVAVEAVAVAVGVFVVPVLQTEDFSEISRLEAVFAARMDAVEKTIAKLETQIQDLSNP